MKILHVTEASAAGVLTSVSTLAREQSRLADVTFAYVPRHESPSPADIAHTMGQAVRTIRWDGRIREIALLRGLRSLLGRERFDVIHLHSSRAGVIGRLVAGLHPTCVVYSPHGFAFDRLDFSALSRLTYRAVERAALFIGRRLILVSESEQVVAKRALPGSATGVLANAVDIAALDSLPRSTRDVPPMRIVHIGRIAPPKRPDLFAAVAARVSQARPKGQVSFSWIGDGDRALLGASIEVTGWLDPSAVLTEIATADVVLFTSFGEGLPMALAEAQGLGIPVVASPVTGITDVVRDGETGILAEGEDELVAAIERLIDEPDTRHAMGQNGRAFVREHFDSRRLGPDSLKLYEALGGVSGRATITVEGKA